MKAAPKTHKDSQETVLGEGVTLPCLFLHLLYESMNFSKSTFQHSGNFDFNTSIIQTLKSRQAHQQGKTLSHNLKWWNSDSFRT